MKLLVTGGAGFIGSNFVRQVLGSKPTYSITVVDKLNYAANRKNLSGLPNDRFDFIKGDICDSHLIVRIVSQVDAVVHFAAESHVDNSLAGPQPFIDSNVVGTYELLEAVRKHHKRLHHISTDEVFGDLGKNAPKFNESTAYAPSNPYSATKAASDHLVRAWIRSFKIAATLSNCSNNYGPYHHPEKFIPRAITSILDGKKPKLYGRGHQIRDWIHVADHCNGVLAVLEKGKLGETYLIGANGEDTNLETIKLILKLMGKPANFYEHVADRPGHDERYAINSSKIRKELGWKPQFSFKHGLQQTINWYAANRNWWESQKVKSEANYAKVGR